MSVRKDEATLIITIDAKESVAYQQSVTEAGKLNKALKTAKVGTDEYNKALTETKRISDDLSKTDYTKLSLKNLQDRRKQLIDLQKQLPQNVFAEQGFAAELRNVNQAMRDSIDSTRSSSQQLSVYDSVISSLPPSLQGMAGGLDLVIAKSRALFATPLGWILAVAAAIGTAAKGWFDYNSQIIETRKLTEGITGETGKVAQEIRSQALAIEEVTGASIKNTLQASKVAVTNFAIDYKGALDVIGTGLVDAGNKQDEFLESLNEYGVFFGQAGFTYQEFANIINSGIDLGIYNDKLPDAIKEFSISVNEQTKASKEALENAFGKSFTKDLLGGIKAGTITASEGLRLISNEAERIGLNTQQAAQLTADLFRGAGEDAGGALNIFKAVNEALGDEPRLLTDIQKAQIDSIRLNYELQQSKAEALETESFFQFQKTFRDIWTNVQIGFFDFVAGMVRVFNNFIDTTKINIAIAKAEFNALPQVLRIVRDNFFEAFKDIGTAAMALLSTLGNLLTFDFDAAEKSFDSFKLSIKSAGQNFREAAKDSNAFGVQARKTAEETARAQIAAERKVATEQAKLRQESEKKKTTGSNNFGGASEEEERKNLAEKRKKEAEKEAAEQRKQAEKAFKDRLELAKKFTAALIVEEESRYLNGEITEAQFEENKLKIKAGSITAQLALLRSLGLKETTLYTEKENELLRLKKESNEKKKAADEKLSDDNKKKLDDRLKAVESSTKNELLQVQNQVNSGLLNTVDAEKRRIEILKASYDEQLEILKAAGQESSEEYLAIEQRKTDITTEAIKIRNEKIKEGINIGVDIAGTILDGISDLANQKTENEKNEKISALDQEYARRFELAKGNADLEKKLKKEYEDEKQKIEKQAFEKNKQNRISAALSNAALAIIQSLANTALPFPASLIAPAIIGVQTGFQVAKIRNEKFDQGGSLKLGKRFVGPKHSAGGIKLPWGDEVEGDEVMINAKSSKFFAPELDAINSYRGWGRRLFNLGGSINPNVTPTAMQNVPLSRPGASGGIDDASINKFTAAVDRFVSALPALMNLKAHVVYNDIKAADEAMTDVENAARF